MNIILMTILLTLLAAGLVVLLVWLSVVAWKSMRFKRKFEDLDRRIDAESSSISSSINLVYENIDEKQKDVDKKIEEIYNHFSHEFEELHRETIKSIWDKFDDNQQLVQNRIDALERSIDSRFDKLHNLVTSPQKS